MEVPGWFWAVIFAAAAQNLIPFQRVIRIRGAFGGYVGETLSLTTRRSASPAPAGGWRLHVTRPTSDSRDEIPSRTKHNQQ